MNGMIKKQPNSDKGFGFISGDDGQEYFFHRSAVAPHIGFEKLGPGDRVSFDDTRGPKGLRAERVELA